MKNYKIFYFVFPMMFISNLFPQNITWNWSNGPYDGGHINAIYSDSANLLVADGEKGIFYSSNNGTTWSDVYSLPNSIGLIITSMKFAKLNNNTLLLGCYDGAIGGLFKSTNFGKNWFGTSLGNVGVNDVFVDKNNAIFVATTDGLFKSTDNGFNYSRIGFSGDEISSFFITIDSIYVALKKAQVYRSSINSISWEKIYDKYLPYSYPELGKVFVVNSKIYLSVHGYGLYIYSGSDLNWQKIFSSSITSYSILSNNSILISSYNAGLFMSDDEGQTWNQLGENILPSTILSIHRNQQGNILIGTWRNGVYESKDYGRNWSIIGVPATPIGHIFSSSNMLYCSSSNNIYLSSNKGSFWYKSSLDYNVTITAISSPPNSDIVLVGTKDNGIFKSTDKGQTWQPSNTGLFSPKINFIVFYNNNIYCGTSDDLYFSSDMGSNWNKLNINKEVTEISINKNGDILLQVFYYDIMLKRKDQSQWTQLTLPVSNWQSRIKITNEGNIFLGFNHGDMYKSTNWGLTWQKLNWYNGMVTSNFLQTSNNLIYVASPLGLYVSSDNGTSWQNTDNGIITIPGITEINSLTIDDDGYLYAAALGVFSTYNYNTTDIETDSYDSPIDFSLSQNYPNPFNPITTINYSVPKSNFVTIKVFDILGREVETLVNNEKLKGNYKVEFNGSTLSSGIYFYRMQAGDFVETKKLILIK